MKNSALNEIEIVDIIKVMAYDGKEYHEIKQTLQNLTPKTDANIIKLAEKRIDDYIIEYQLASQEKAKVLNQIITGIILLLLGLGITAYTYFSKNSQYVLSYGAILGGAWILKEGYKKYQRPLEEFVPRRSRFRK